jgi:uncharacterized protein YndB with AHSA1/START domain
LTESITTVLHLPHPPERVWRAISEPEHIEAWLMPNDFRPVVGHRFTFQTRPIPPGFDGIVHCEVLVVDRPRHLAYRWQGGPLDTEVHFRLEPEAAGTVLHFEHSGFDLSRPEQEMAYKGMAPGWTSHMAKRLAEVVDALPVA